MEMNKVRELEILIEKTRGKLTNYLNEDKSPEEVLQLSEELDALIVEYSRLVK